MAKSRNRNPYRVLFRDARFDVVRINLESDLSDTLPVILASLPTASSHATEAEAERWIRDEMMREYNRDKESDT